MNPMTNALLDTVVKFGFVIVLAFLIRSVLRGDFRIDPNHKYAEAQVHAYNVVGEWNHYRGDASISHFHEECASDYLNDNLAIYPYFEVYLEKKDTDNKCDYCE